MHKNLLGYAVNDFLVYEGFCSDSFVIISHSLGKKTTYVALYKVNASCSFSMP